MRRPTRSRSFINDSINALLITRLSSTCRRISPTMYPVPLPNNFFLFFVFCFLFFVCSMTTTLMNFVRRISSTCFLSWPLPAYLIENASFRARATVREPPICANTCPRDCSRTTYSRCWRTKTGTSGGSQGRFSRRAVACRATLRRLRFQFTCARCTCKRAQPFHRSPAPDRVFLAPPPKKKEDKAAGSFVVWGGNRCRFFYVFVAGL